MRVLLIILLCALIFYVLSSFAMTLPFAPWPRFDALITIVAPIIFSAIFIYIAFFIRNKQTKKTPWEVLVIGSESWKAAIKWIFMIFFAPPIFGYLLAFSIHRWPAYPAYFLANQTIDTYLYCVEKKNYSKESRGLVMMKLKYSDEEYLKLPWPKGEAPRCPGFVQVRGKKGFFGVYFTDVK